MEQPEYLAFRCCMCPNISTSNKICPPGPLKKDKTPCRFVKTYIDSRGWLYKVMSGFGENNFKVGYKKPGNSGWKYCSNLEGQECFDEAQSDLNALAKAKRWEVHTEYNTD